MALGHKGLVRVRQPAIETQALMPSGQARSQTSVVDYQGFR